jgi:hypothetical protein
MNLAESVASIRASIDRLNAAYGEPLFNEWVLVGLGGSKPGIRSYHGPRSEQFQTHFLQDIEPIRREMANRSISAGEFEFANDASGSRFDAVIALGDDHYLLCNHTKRTMAEIRREPRWLAAQTIFFNLSEKFRLDPLEAEAS